MDNKLLTFEENSFIAELEARGEYEQAKIRESELQSRRLNMRNVLATDAGKDIIWGVLSSCGIFSSVMTGNSQTYFKEGRRSVGLELLNEIIASSPDVWIEMQREKMLEIQQTLNESER